MQFYYPVKKLVPASLVVLALSLSGCAWVERHTPWYHTTASSQPASSPAQPAPAGSQYIVTPDNSLMAKVIKVNTVGQFVILNFPDGRMPKMDQHMFLYRTGLKTAEVKVVGPQEDTSIVADIISGDAQTGDTVRDR